MDYKNKYLKMKLKYINSKYIQGGSSIRPNRARIQPRSLQANNNSSQSQPILTHQVNSGPLTVITYNLNINIQKNKIYSGMPDTEKQFVQDCMSLTNGESCIKNSLTFATTYVNNNNRNDLGFDVLLITECYNKQDILDELQIIDLHNNYIGIQNEKPNEQHHRASCIIFKNKNISNLVEFNNEYNGISLNYTIQKNGRDIKPIRSCMIVYDLESNIIYICIWLNHLGNGNTGLRKRLECFKMVDELIRVQISDLLLSVIGIKKHPAGKPRIICGGDFNDHNHPKLYTQSIEFDSLNVNIEVPNTGGKLNSCCYSSWNLTSDYIFDSKPYKAKFLGVPIDQLIQTQGYPLLSDHSPIVLETFM